MWRRVGLAHAFPHRKQVGRRGWTGSPLFRCPICHVCARRRPGAHGELGATRASGRGLLGGGCLLALGCTGLAVGLGALFATFEWESPNKLSTGFGTLVLLLSSLILVAINTVFASVIIAIIIIPAISEILGTFYAIVDLIASGILIVGLNYYIAMKAINAGSRALKYQVTR